MNLGQSDDTRARPMSRDLKMPPIDIGQCLALDNFIDPFTISKQINSVTYRLSLPNPHHINPTFHVSLLKPYHPSLSLSPSDFGVVHDPPPPLLLDDWLAYTVYEILDP